MPGDGAEFCQTWSACWPCLQGRWVGAEAVLTLRVWVSVTDTAYKEHLWPPTETIWLYYWSCGVCRKWQVCGPGILQQQQQVRAWEETRKTEIEQRRRLSQLNAEAFFIFRSFREKLLVLKRKKWDVVAPKPFLEKELYRSLGDHVYTRIWYKGTHIPTVTQLPGILTSTFFS